MRARTAPDPISSGAMDVGDYRSRARVAVPKRQTGLFEDGEQESVASVAPAPVQPEADVSLSASAFTAALISSRENPSAMEQREKVQKLARAALPAQGSLALTDRRV